AAGVGAEEDGAPALLLQPREVLRPVEGDGVLVVPPEPETDPVQDAEPVRVVMAKSVPPRGPAPQRFRSPGPRIQPAEIPERGPPPLPVGEEEAQDDGPDQHLAEAPPQQSVTEAHAEHPHDSARH